VTANVAIVEAPATPSPRFDLFLSHNSRDKAQVRAVDERLRDEGGLRPWLDEIEIPGGAEWDATIRSALSACAGCIIFLSGEGWGHYHLAEARLAFARRHSGFPVVIVLLPGANPALLKELDEDVDRWEWADLRDGLDNDSEFHSLLVGVHPRPHTIPPLEGVVRLSPYLIRRTARRWKKAGRGLDLLFRGEELDDANTIAREQRTEMNELAWEFLEASQRARLALKKRERRPPSDSSRA
jgi:hypothetical protein